MGGPWFTVLEDARDGSGGDWHVLAAPWISDHGDYSRARVELRVRFDEDEGE